MSKTYSVELETIFPVIQEKLLSGGSVTFSPKGSSMLPLIRQGIDSVRISPVNGKLKKYDVPLYRRKNGQFVLHRVVSVDRNGYVMCGDNQIKYEHGIDDSCIIGIMTQIIKPEGIIDVTQPEYIKYYKKRVAKQKLKRYWSVPKRFIKFILVSLRLYKR